jgi:hypothetical protein
MSEALQTEAVEIPPEVIAFARERQVEAYLPVMVELVREHIPAPALRVVLEEDPEIEGLRHIVLCTGAVRMSVAEALAAKARYRRAVSERVPAPLLCTFRLGLELAP